MLTVELNPAIDVSGLFEGLGLEAPIAIQFNQHTYEYDAEPKNNWLYFALKGFEALKQKCQWEQKPISTFASIGTGSGLDAIGAYHIFEPETVLISDIHPEVISLAAENVRQYVPRASVIALQGSLCEPLRQIDCRADVIYANLPLIPFSGQELLEGMNTSSFASPEALRKAPKLYDEHLLGMIYAFLQEARHSLQPGGSVVVNLGGRMPVDIVEQLFEECGYAYSELYHGFKIQTQHLEVIPGFSLAERQYGVEFDYYAYEKAKGLLERHSPFGCAQEMKSYLSPCRASASQAWERCQQGEQFGHLVQVIRGQLDHFSCCTENSSKDAPQ